MTDIKNKELLEYVCERLDYDRADSDHNDLHLTMTVSPETGRRIHAKYMYGLAKDEARKNNFGPLLKYLKDLTGDPKLPDLITGKRQPRQRHAELKERMPKIKAHTVRRDRADAVKRIRELIEEKIKKRPSQEDLVDIAAEILKCEPDDIRAAIKLGKRAY